MTRLCRRIDGFKSPAVYFTSGTHAVPAKSHQVYIGSFTLLIGRRMKEEALNCNMYMSVERRYKTLRINTFSLP